MLKKKIPIVGKNTANNDTYEGKVQINKFEMFR